MDSGGIPVRPYAIRILKGGEEMAFFEFPHTRTYDSDLGWLIKNVKSYDDTIAALNEWIAVNTPRIEDLEAFKDAMESGQLPAGVQQGIAAWLSVNGAQIIAAIIKNVWFGLTDAGYFVAYVPDSWQDITFKTTGWDIILDLMPDYGHLVLQY